MNECMDASSRFMKKGYYRALVASLRKISPGRETTVAAGGAVSPKFVVETAGPSPDDPLDPEREIWRVRNRKMTSQEIRGAIRDNCSLIKTVDRDLVPGIERRVKRIHEGTSTPSTLARYLETTCDLEPWQADRIVNDQLQKFAAAARLASFRKAGVKVVRWVSGNSKEPRPWHCHHWPHGLNGMEFNIDEPPVIDPKTGERGYPGQLINCKCRLEAVR